MIKIGISKKTDYILILTTIVIALVGVLMVYSTAPDYNKADLCLRHLSFVLLGFVLLYLTSRINYQMYYQSASYLYGFSIFLLVLVLFVGKSVRGARSWFFIGNFSFQPVELMKLTTILFVSKVLVTIKKNTYRITSFVKPLIFIMLPICLILFQPDLGSGLIFVPILLVFLYIGEFASSIIFSIFSVGFLGLGIPLFITWVNVGTKSDILKRISLCLSSIPHNIIVLFVIVAIIGFIFYISNKYFKMSLRLSNLLWISLILTIGFAFAHIIRVFIKPYQQQRLIAFLNPAIDPLGTGYHIIQSEIAIGSGGLFGKGLMAGTQSQLGFLPVQHTDFIFASLAEETGFIGAGTVLFLYLVFLWRGVYIAINSRNLYGGYLSIGLVSMYLFPIIFNIGMVMGIMPVTGIPLPLLSYGGSSLTVSLLGIGILLNVYRKRHTH